VITECTNFEVESTRPDLLQSDRGPAAGETVRLSDHGSAACEPVGSSDRSSGAALEFDARFFDDARSRDQFRQALLAEYPRWYSPWAHLAGTLTPGLAALALSIAFVSELRAIELLTFPITFVIANLFEWHAHRNLLHRRWPLAGVLYDRHTPQHHRIYRYADMAMQKWPELRLVLIPAYGVFGLVAINTPLAMLIGWLLGPNVGWLFLLTTALYVVSYELTHLSYHLPAQSFIGRRAFVRWMREHHARHHDPRLMQRWNFNVTLPLGDWLFGTIAPKELVDTVRARPQDLASARLVQQSANRPSASPAVAGR
jgi:sterol desaturase/sphingolipid hydroxylase (fatty acid hydroxylase superfamily)